MKQFKLLLCTCVVVVNYLLYYFLTPRCAGGSSHKSDTSDRAYTCSNLQPVFSTVICLFFVWFDSLRPSQQSLSYVGTGLPELNLSKLMLMCLAQGRNAVTPERLEPASLWSRVNHSTTEPLRSLFLTVTHLTLHTCTYKCNKGQTFE